jgi:hypothetical protein
VLHTLNQEHLQPLRNYADRDLLLKPLAYFQDIPTVDLDSIDFILDSSDPDLLNVLLDCQNKWNNVNGLAGLRSSEYRRFQERLAQAERQGELPPRTTPTDIRATVGGEMSGSLRSLTDLLYDALDKAVQANEDSFKRLSDQLRRQFPGQRVLEREWDPEVAGATPGRNPGG